MKSHPDINDTARTEGVDAARARHDRAEKYKSAPLHDLRFKLERFDTIKLITEPGYLVKGIVPREGIVVAWGPPKCGKSFWTFDLVMHIALGLAYRGRKVRQGAVVYLALEGGAGFRRRVVAWQRKHPNSEGVPFYLLTVPVDLIADHAKLIADVRAQVDAPAVVVIDTLNRSLNGSENDSEDMAKYIRAADAIRTTFMCVAFVVHHCGIEGTRPRGHTSLTGAADAQIAVERDDATGITTAKVEYMKDGEAGAVIVSRLERVELGNDDDGDLITSCIVVPVDGEAVKQRGPKLTGKYKVALELLQRAIIDAGEKPPASNHIPPDKMRVVRIDVFRRYFYEGTVDSGQDPDTKRRTFSRVVERLQSLGVIGVWNGFLWLARTTRTSPDKADFVRSDLDRTDKGHTLKGVPVCPGHHVRPEGEP